MQRSDIGNSVRSQPSLADINRLKGKGGGENRRGEGEGGESSL